jgi:DNA topoisomerase-1
MPRLRRSVPGRSGWTRRRSGTGFVFLDQHGTRLTDPEQVRRIKDLVIPPAWRDVWICPWPNGHLQAVGTDARGRRQYLYHPDWTAQRGKAKHAHVLDFARRLPAARARAAEHLALPGMPRERALAAAFRLLDLGLFRIGSESYAEENGSFGLATVRKEHVRVSGSRVTFDYVAKSGNRRILTVEDEAVVDVVGRLRRRRGGGDELLAFRQGRSWTDLASVDINGYVKDVVSHDASAKDFRTWHATVLAAVALARAGAPTSATAEKRLVAGAIKEVAEHMGNTPAVCRSAYVDPRVIDRFHDGTTIRAALARAERRERAEHTPPTADEGVERAVLRLLS